MKLRPLAPHLGRAHTPRHPTERRTQQRGDERSSRVSSARRRTWPYRQWDPKSESAAGASPEAAQHCGKPDAFQPPLFIQATQRLY